MTLDEAIEIKSLSDEQILAADPEKLIEADRLSLEALKRIQSDRQGTFILLLPGETEE